MFSVLVLAAIVLDPMDLERVPPRPSRPRHLRGGPFVDGHAPVVQPLLSPRAIRRTVTSRLHELGVCEAASAASAPEGARGRVALRIVIGGDGHVLAAQLAEQDFVDPAFGVCAVGVVRRWQFPAPEGNGIVTVVLPFSVTLTNSPRRQERPASGPPAHDAGVR